MIFRKTHVAVAMVALSSIVILAPGAAKAEKYYDEDGKEIHWMEPNFLFGVLRGALVVAQGPLEFFPAVADFARKQGKAKSGDDALANVIAALGIVGPFGAVVGSVTHSFCGVADIITLGMCSDGIYSSGVVTPLIWEEKGFLKGCKITKGYASSHDYTPVSTPQPLNEPASVPLSGETTPSTTVTPDPVPTSVPVVNPAPDTKKDNSQPVPVPTSVPFTDDD